MKQNKRSRFIAFLLSLVMVCTMIPAVALAAEGDYYFQEDSLSAGKFVLAVQESDGSYHALKAEAGNTEGTKITKSADVKVENGSIANPDDPLVWTCTTSTASGETVYKLVSNSNGSLYFSASDKLKYQDQGYRNIHVADQKLYIDTSEDSNAGTKDTTVVMSYDASTHEFSVETGANSDRAAVLAKGAAVTFFKLPASEDEAIEKAKANALRAIDDANCEDADIVAAAKQAVADATSVEAVNDALKDFETAAAEAAKKAEELKAAKKDAINAIDDVKCDDAKLVAEYKEKINNAANKEEVANLLKEFKEKASGGSNPDVKPDNKGGSTTSDVDKEKETATADVNKAIGVDNLNKYDADEQKAIKDLVAQYIIKINAATTVNDVKNLMNAFNAAIKGIPTKADKAAIAKIQVKIKKIKVGKKKMTVKWTPKKANFDGYELSYVPKPKKKAKKVTIKKATASKKVIKKLKKGKKYKVKIRGYKLFGTTKVYGKWSKAKTSKKIK
jgi:hypothetical protein